VNPVVAEIFRTRRVVCPDGSSVPFEYSVSEDEGAALQQAIREVRPRVTLEVGLAHGVSSALICEALKDVGGERHIVIDPGPLEGWNEIGLHTIARAGYSGLVRFYNEPSHQVLPRLEAEGERIGFAHIDGWHSFDYVFVDFFYVDRLLQVGGVVMFDDARLYPAIRKVARYVATHRRYTPLPNPGSHGAASMKRRLLNAAGAALRRGPFKGIAAHVVRPDVLAPDSLIGLPPDDYVAFRKIGEDALGDGSGGTRRWDQHVEF
jgi:predicted O-methyltransferase YrrM